MKYKETAHRMLAFLQESPTCYHAVGNIAQRLRQDGYQQLWEFEPWQLLPGGKYYVLRGDSSLMAFRVPRKEFRGFMLAAAHSDSPTLKMRQEAETASAGNCLRLSVEPYGGTIFSSWMDRPLSVAGRVMVRREDRVECCLVNVERDLLVIPSVAIHMNREANKGTALNPAVDLLPLWSLGKEPGAFHRLIAEEVSAEEEDILSTELFLYPRMPGVLTGANEEFVVSPRLDDLQCVFGCMEGFILAAESDSLPVLCVFNNEEVGSGTRQGADSTFLSDVLGRIADGLGLSPQRYHQTLANSFMVSADNAHAVHPAHPEYADKQEQPVLGGGIVVKYSANQRYTTDALSDAVFCQICREAKVPVQRFSNRADLPGGSTLGNISTSHLSVPTVDIGLPQLAMHTACEVAGTADTQWLVEAMTAYYNSSLELLPDGFRVH